jgi:hypothetical protein
MPLRNAKIDVAERSLRREARGISGAGAAFRLDASVRENHRVSAALREGHFALNNSKKGADLAIAKNCA